MNQRVWAIGDDVAGENDLLLGEIDDQISAGVRGPPMKQFERDAIYLDRFFALGNEAGGQTIGRRCAVSSGGDGALLLFLVVFLGNDRDAGRKGGKAVHMISVAVRQDHGGDGIRRDFGDVIQQLFSGGGIDLRVDYDHALVAHDYSTIATAAFHPGHVAPQGMNEQGFGRRVLGGCDRGESAESDGQAEHETEALGWHGGVLSSTNSTSRGLSGRDRIGEIAAIRTVRALLLAALATLVPVLFAQLPPSEKLSAEDSKGFREELERVRDLLKSANDKGAVEFQIARTYAAGGQYREAMDWLQRVVDSNLGFDPSRDKLFARLQGTHEFQSVMDKVRAQTPAVSHSRLVATVPEPDLFPENLAYDAATKSFFFGSTFKDEIVRCDQQSVCAAFVGPHKDGLGYVLGIKIHRASRTLWATSNTEDGATLRQYSLVSGELIGNYPLSGAHLFNDVAVSSSGEVFVTDTKEGAVYKLSGEASGLERLAAQHVFTAANGIALSRDEKKLFVASFGDGIAAVDLASQSVTALPYPANVCLAYIDGLYATEGSLIAIQNGPMVPRIVRFVLNSEGTAIVAMDILERRNPLFDGITTGVLVGDQLYYVANSQLDKVVDGKVKRGVTLDPLHILAIGVDSR